MWDYSKEVIEHYKNPKNVGEIENPSAIGEAGSLTCGDALKLYLKIDENEVITDAKFQTFGCGSAVASSSILTEMIIGKPLEEVKKITNRDIVEQLGGLPPEKLHCSVMGREALESAIANYYGITPSNEPEDKIICVCNNMSERAIVEAIKENNLRTLEEVINGTKAGATCGRCLDKVEKILKKTLASEDSAPSDLTPAQLVLKINGVIESYISNELQKDGGDIELVDVKGNQVYLKLKGACSACRNSRLTLKGFVENTLREHISQDIEVIEVK